MNTVPNMISTKDLSYLVDMFEWNMVSAKKSFHFAGHVTDPKVKDALHEVATMYQNHCSKILELLKQGENL